MTEDPTPEALRARFIPLLQAELAALQAQSSGTTADRAPVVLDQQSVGRLSRMDAMQGQQMAAAMEERRRQRINRIRQALRRLEGDDFGFCDDCGAFIGEGRLAADPIARRCISCAR